MPYPDSEYPSILRGKDKRDSQRLLAAAPEMLAALREVCGALVAMDWEGEGNRRHWDATQLDQLIAGTLHVVNQAIDKAEGRSE
jgi:hypothetical protein